MEKNITPINQLSWKDRLKSYKKHPGSFTASGGSLCSDHRDSTCLSGGLYFDPRCSVFKTKPVFTDLQFR